MMKSAITISRTSSTGDIGAPWWVAGVEISFPRALPS